MKRYILGRKNYYILIAIFSVLLFSCSEEFYDKGSEDKITPDQYYNTYAEVMIGYMGAYSLVQEASIDLVVLNGLLSDEMDVNSNATRDMKELNTHSVSPGNDFADPSAFYKIVVNANELLNNIEIVSTRDKDFEQIDLFYMEGALVALRSWAYFNIIKLYGEAIIIDDNLPNYTSQTGFTKVSRKDMIDTLINHIKPYLFEERDLELELWLGPESFNKEALLAELYNEQNKPGSADSTAKYARMAIESLGNSSDFYKITNQYEDVDYENIFIGATNQFTEVYSAIPFSLDDNQYNWLENYFDIDYQIKPSQNIISLFESQEFFSGAPGDIYRGIGVSYDTLPGGQISYIKKYSHETSNPLSADIPILRAADMHLIMAEALNRIGDTTTAMILINSGFRNTTRPRPPGFVGWNKNVGVRGRVYLAPVGAPALDDNAKMLYIEDLIINERAMELAYEGKRWYDLMRIARRRNNPGYLASKVASKFSNENTKTQIYNKLSNESNWYLPKDY